MGMFVRRNAFGDIVAVSRSALGAEWDEIPDHAPALREFLAESGWQRDNPFAQSDAELVRVLEDLVQVLVQRNVIRFTDLPPEAQAKLSSRQGLRDRMNRLNLLDDSDSDVI